MATEADAARMALALPEVVEGTTYGNRAWFVDGTSFAWIRPLRKADIKRFGDEIPPKEPILAVRVEDLDEKEAVLAAGSDALFTILHFDGYPAVLVELRKVKKTELRELILDGWLASAPDRLTEPYLE
jgi:hypothetical protein